jgi:copper chaperone CopZ
MVVKVKLGKEITSPWLVRIRHNYYGGDVDCGYCGNEMWSRYEIHMELCPNCFKRLVKCFPKPKGVKVEKIDLTKIEVKDRLKNEFEKLIDDEIRYWSTTKHHIPPHIKLFPEKLVVTPLELFDSNREHVLFELKFLKDKLRRMIE